MPINANGVPVAPLDEDTATYAAERALAADALLLIARAMLARLPVSSAAVAGLEETTPHPRSARGRWIVRSLTSELWIDGKLAARVYPISNRGYHYEIPDVTTGWAASRYAAQRAVRKALKEVEND